MALAFYNGRMPSKPTAKTTSKTRARPAPRRVPRRAGSAGTTRTPVDAGGTLAERAYRQIEEMLVTLEIPPGALMSELDLAKRLGISRTPVGEAISRLSRSGLVAVLPRRGFIATEISVTSQLRLLELRSVIARLVARLAALRALPEQRARLVQTARTMAAAAGSGDELSYLAADQAFHPQLADCAQNDFVAQALDDLEPQIRRFWYANRHHAGGELLSVARLHIDLAAAIERGNADEAAAASDVLSEGLERFTRATIDPVAQRVRAA